VLNRLFHEDFLLEILVAGNLTLHVLTLKALLQNGTKPLQQ